MENTLGFEDKDPSEDEWSTNAKSEESLIRKIPGESQETVNPQNIVLVPHEIIHTDRPIIPASWMEKLSYYRAFTSSSSKIEILCLQQNNINMFMWFYVSNTLCKSLSMTYVYIFLSAYSPDHHFFVPKMVPIFYGLKWINVICATFLLQIIALNTSTHFYYAIAGIIFKAPWNRCMQRTLFYVRDNDTTTEYTCMELKEFAAQFVNNTNITMLDATLYRTPTDEYFSIAQIEHFDFLLHFELWGKFQCLIFAMRVLVWITAAVLYKQLFKSWIWKLLHYAQLALCVFLFFILLHLLVCYEDEEIQRMDSGESGMRRELLMLGDFDMLAETMTAPPVAHVLSSRTTADVRPSLHSALVVVSNGIFYVFKALTTTLMKQYCDRWVNATIIHWSYGSESNFYFWPIYFATLPYGDVIAVAFFTLNAIVESCMFVITFQCLIEVVKYEWSWMKPWCIAGTTVLLSIAEVIYILKSSSAEETFSSNSFILFMSLSSLIEIVVIVWIYPLERFLEDINFHFGAAPTRLRRWTFRLLPWFHSYKIVVMIILLYRYFSHEKYFSTILHLSRHVPTCVIILLLVGAVYAFYKYVVKGKKGFSQLFKPVPEWGPKDFRLRQLRKQYDSREYIASQAPRNLSRYMIEKAGMSSYKLDMPYETRRKLASRLDLKDGKQKER